MMILFLSLIYSVAVSLSGYFLYMRLPADWLCEYDELPGAMHFPGFRGGSIIHRTTIACRHSASARTAICCRRSVTAFTLLWCLLLWGAAAFSITAGEYDAASFWDAAGAFSPGSIWDSAGAFSFSCFLNLTNYFATGIPQLLMQLFFDTIIAILLFIAAAADLDYHIIPDQICAVLFLTAIVRAISISFADTCDAVSRAVSGQSSSLGLISLDAISFVPTFMGSISAGLVSALGESLLGAVFAAGLMLIPALLFNGSIGFGDIKLLGACGAICGRGAAVMFSFSVMASGVFVAVCLLIGRLRPGQAIPLGPWICVGTILVAHCYYV